MHLNLVEVRAKRQSIAALLSEKYVVIRLNFLAKPHWHFVQIALVAPVARTYFFVFDLCLFVRVLFYTDI